MQIVAMAVIMLQAPLRDAAKIAPWLYQIAVRQSLMYRRTHGRRRKLEKRYSERVEADPGPSKARDPLEWLLHTERRERIRQAINRLSPKEAEILMLKYTQDWSYRQIAEHLGVTESAVESRLHRARKNLRQEMVALEVVESE